MAKMSKVKDVTIGIAVSPKKKKEIEDFCDERDWFVSAFGRIALDEAMASAIAREKGKEKEEG